MQKNLFKKGMVCIILVLFGGVSVVSGICINVEKVSTVGSEQPSGENVAPTQSGESPTNGSINIDLEPDLYVVCTDTDGDIMNATGNGTMIII